jgi:lipopolysaccharide biosynthesis regulator YciM
MLNLLWLLLPVAAAAGWFAARRSGAARPEAFWNYTSNFHQGLNELLSESQEIPADLFDNIGNSIGKSTAETHLALGNFYRRRGDVNRAILLHESLLDYPELGDEVHADALLELAKDYDTAGLLDRSEQTLRRLIKIEHKLPESYAALLQLHERERDWDLAIDVAREIERSTGVDHSALVAHYHCELAQTALSEGYTDESKRLLHLALDSNPQCARSHVMLAEMASAAGDSKQALEHYATVENLRPELMPAIIEPRFKALAHAGNEAATREFIDGIKDRRNAYSVVRITRGVIEELDGPEKADRFFKSQILQRPSLKGLRDWAHDQVQISRPGEREKVQVICAMLDSVVEDKPSYRCTRCGFLGNMLHWRCPSCNSWDSVSPIIGVEGE